LSFSCCLGHGYPLNLVWTSNLRIWIGPG
jgi:hypothetical protein